MKLSNKRYKRSLSHIITDSAKKSSVTNEKKCSIQTSSSATVVSASSTKSSFTVLPSLRRSMKKKLQKNSTRTSSSSSSSSLSLSLKRLPSKKLQKESTAHTTSSSVLCEIEEDVPNEAEDTVDTLLENKPNEMKAEDEETTPTLETAAPVVQPTLFDHITNVTDSMIDLVESLSTEAEETKEPEDAKVEDNAFTNAEEDGSHNTAAKNDTPTAVENKPSTPVPSPVPSPVSEEEEEEEEEDIIPDIEAAHTNEEPSFEAVLQNETIAIGIHKQLIPEESPNTWSNVSYTSK